MRRGEVWTVSGGGHAGTPRPAVIVQDDRFDATASVTVCVFTTGPHRGAPVPPPGSADRGQWPAHGVAAHGGQDHHRSQGPDRSPRCRRRGANEPGDPGISRLGVRSREWGRVLVFALCMADTISKGVGGIGKSKTQDLTL